MSHCLLWAATCEREKEREIVTAISLSATSSLMMSYAPMELVGGNSGMPCLLVGCNMCKRERKREREKYVLSAKSAEKH
jgi:hypothetical protein